MQSNNNTASAYFDANWQRYKTSVNNNMLHHREMFAAVNTFLNEHLGKRPISLMDLGCGDSSAIAPVLTDKNIDKYIGIDAAANVLKLASINLAHLNCEKEFICEDMLEAVSRLNVTVDVILTSYAVHHLSLKQKIEFIHSCKSKLAENGFLLMIDGVLDKQQTRDEWLDALKERFKVSNPGITPDELEQRMQHPRAGDFPEYIETFEKIAKEQGWKNFRVLVDKNIFAFLVFSK